MKPAHQPPVFARWRRAAALLCCCLPLLLQASAAAFTLDESLFQARKPVETPWLPSDEMQRLFDSIKNKDYRPESVLAQEGVHEVLYKIHFVYNDDNRAYVIWWGQTPQEYEKSLLQYEADGYTLVWKEVLGLQDGGKEYQTIWYKLD